MSEVILKVTLEHVLESRKEVIEITGIIIGFKTFDSGHFILIADGNGTFYANPESYKITKLITESSYLSVVGTPSYNYIKEEFDKFVRLGKIKLDDNGVIENWKRFPPAERRTYKLNKGAEVLTFPREARKKERYKLITNKADEILEMLYGRKQRHFNANTNSRSGSS